MADKGAPEELDDRKKRQAWLESLSPEELETVRNYAWDRLLRARKVNVNGKQVSLKALAEDVRKKQEEYDRGLYDEDVRTIPRWQAQQLVPSDKLRPGSYKQILRPEEEEALELTRLGNGQCFTSRKKFFGVEVPWQRNFAYGIFARPDRVQAVLGPTWAGHDPEAVVQSPGFYDDILRRCNQVELTLMLLTSRPLKMKEVAPAVEKALTRGMERITGDVPLKEEHTAALKDFMHKLDERRLMNGGFIENGSIMKGTHFILTADPKGGLLAEAITPGTLSQRKTSFLGGVKNPLLTLAVFDAFLGPQSTDPLGKKETGRAFLWAAHGLPFEPYQGDGKVVAIAGEDGRTDFAQTGGVQEELVPRTSLFRLTQSGDKPAPMVLNKIKLRMA